MVFPQKCPSDWRRLHENILKEDIEDGIIIQRCEQAIDKIWVI